MEVYEIWDRSYLSHDRFAVLITDHLRNIGFGMCGSESTGDAMLVCIILVVVWSKVHEWSVSDAVREGI